MRKHDFVKACPLDPREIHRFNVIFDIWKCYSADDLFRIVAGNKQKWYLPGHSLLVGVRSFYLFQDCRTQPDVKASYLWQLWFLLRDSALAVWRNQRRNSCGTNSCLTFNSGNFFKWSILNHSLIANTAWYSLSQSSYCIQRISSHRSATFKNDLHFVLPCTCFSETCTLFYITT